MAKLVFIMNVSLDGYVNHELFVPPGPLLFKYFIEHTRNATGSIYGRGLYEVMRYWDGSDWHQDDPEQCGFASIRGGVAAHAEMGGIALTEVRRSQRDFGWR